MPALLAPFVWNIAQRPSQPVMSSDGSRLSGGEDRRGSRNDRIHTEQVTDNERSTNVRVTDV